MMRFIVVVSAAAAVFSARATENGFRLYNVVPMYLGHETEQARACVEMYERTGEDLALYSLTLHPEGRPAQEKVDRYVASYRAFAKALAGTKVRPGVLVQAVNLCSDPIRALKLRTPGGAKLERLMPDGTWQPVAGDIRVEFYETVVVRW